MCGLSPGEFGPLRASVWMHFLGCRAEICGIGSLFGLNIEYLAAITTIWAMFGENSVILRKRLDVVLRGNGLHGMQKKSQCKTPKKSEGQMNYLFSLMATMNAPRAVTIPAKTGSPDVVGVGADGSGAAGVAVDATVVSGVP